MNCKKILSAIMAIFICLTILCPAFAEEKPVMELYFDSDNYSKGDIVAADIIVYNATYNVLGFALEYGDNVTVVDENGNKSDNDASLLKIEDELSRGEGIYSLLSADITQENIKSIVYVNPISTSGEIKNNCVSAGSEGRKIATLYFEMASDGVPDVEFTSIPGDPEFDSTAYLMLDDGKNPEGATTKITYRTQEKPVKPKDEKKDDTPPSDPKNEEDAPDKNNNISVILPQQSDPEGILPEDSIILDGPQAEDINIPGNASDDAMDDAEGKSDDEISPLERALGLGVLGFAFGITGAIVLKKIMDGARKED